MAWRVHSKLVVLAFTTACAAEFSCGQRLQPLSVESVLQVREFSQLKPIAFSPDGHWLAYTVGDNQKRKTTEEDLYYRTGIAAADGSQICISNTMTLEMRCLGDGKSNDWLPAWSPDGHYLAFFSDGDHSGQARLWVWDASKNYLRRISTKNIRGDEIQWTPDGRSILITAVPQELSIEEYVSRASFASQGLKSTKIGGPGSTAIVYQSNDMSSSGPEAPRSDPWSLNGFSRDLILVNISSGETKTIVRGQKIAKYALSPNGLHVAYTTPKRFEKPGSQQILFDLMTIDLDMSPPREMASDVQLAHDGAQFSWSPDSTRLCFQVTVISKGGADIYVADALSGIARSVTTLGRPAAAFWQKRPLWSLAGDKIYFVRDGAVWTASSTKNEARELARVSGRDVIQLIGDTNNSLWTTGGGNSTVVLTHDETGKQDGFYKVDLSNGESTLLQERGECYSCIRLDRLAEVATSRQRVAYFAEDAQHDADIWLSDPNFRSPQKLTHLNSQLDRYEMGAARLIEWRSIDGDRLQGALLLPPDFQVGPTYPLIVWVYGGANLSNHFDHFGLAGTGPFNMQLLATRGFAVLLPDMPQHAGTPLGDLVKTVLPGVDKVVEMGIADPARIGVMGHSYGGYSTLGLIVQTNRFKAAIEADGMGDLISAYGQMGKDGTAFQTSVIEEGQGLMGGSLWQFRERFIENSPIFYLDRVETPLLIVHGSEDTAVAAFLGDEVFVALRRLGKKVEFAKFEGEGHSPLYWTYANQTELCNRMLDWFSKHLKSGAN
jgi:dipeptidyl aminopeptidase/acylaminoacyl peptidase